MTEAPTHSHKRSSDPNLMSNLSCVPKCPSVGSQITNSLYGAGIAVAVFNPYTFYFMQQVLNFVMRSYAPTIIKTASDGKGISKGSTAPNWKGLLLHTIVFFLLVWVFMAIGVGISKKNKKCN